MWIDTYNQHKLKLDVELSTFCNARCPQCMRTDQNDKCKPKPYLFQESMTIAEFKQFFPPETLHHISLFIFSGTFGDPGMCKDLFPICEYITNNDPTTRINLNTNGSMRDDMYWWKLGMTCGPRLKVIFDIDGLDQEMHALYRRGTDLNKIIANAKAVIDSAATTSVFTVLFKHNQDAYPKMLEWFNELGFDSTSFVESNRFHKGAAFKFQDEEGNTQILEQATKPEYAQDPDTVSRRVRDHRNTSEDYNAVECMNAVDDKIKITAAGMVYPCCFLSTAWDPVMEYNSGQTTVKEAYEGPVAKEFMDNPADFSLRRKSLKEILLNPWFDKNLEESFETEETTNIVCKWNCGKCD